MTHLINSYYFIDDLPEDAREIIIYRTSLSVIFFEYEENITGSYLLPPGSWSIVGWEDYIDNDLVCDNPIPSFASLLKSKGITKRVLILKK